MQILKLFFCQFFELKTILKITENVTLFIIVILIYELIIFTFDIDAWQSDESRGNPTASF